MQQKRVLLAMSGGVDSSVAAIILTNLGYQVSGVTFKLFCYGKSDSGPKSCCGLEGIRDAQSVCNRLGIGHTVVDLEDTFRAKVFDNFLSEYENGRTPVPCVQCNTHIKFNELLNLAHKWGYDYVATGHYAKMDYTFDGLESIPMISESLDVLKDQTFFLWGIEKHLLPRILFPLGDYTKNKVRQIAIDNGLINASKPDSQNLCFVEDGKTHLTVLQEHLPTSSVIFENFTIKLDSEDGEILGQSSPAGLTIGQKIGTRKNSPILISKIDIKKKLILATHKDSMFKNSWHIKDTNFFAGERMISEKMLCRIRHRGTMARCNIVKSQDPNLLQVVCSDGDTQYAPTPGQSCVFYYNGMLKFLLGGGIIV